MVSKSLTTTNKQGSGDKGLVQKHFERKIEHKISQVMKMRDFYVK